MNSNSSQADRGIAWRLGVSGGNRRLRERIVGALKSLSEAGAERAIIDGAANLKQRSENRRKTTASPPTPQAGWVPIMPSHITRRGNQNAPH